MASFSSLPPPVLAPFLLRAVEEEGYTKATPIQAQCIPAGVQGRDILGCAQTGTGKTAAFALPILHRLSETPVDKTRRGPVIPRALILSPTRELATQIGESFVTYGRYTSLSYAIIFGGVSQFHQVKALQRGVDILIATPGRLIDLLDQGLVNLSGVSIFVLDEADRMLDMGFIQPIRRIVSALPPASSSAGTRQTLLFSATMPKEIVHLAEALLRNPVRVAVTPVASAAPLIEQRVYGVPRMRKLPLLEHLLRDKAVKRAVVFTRTKHGADKLCRKLNQDGFHSLAIHGNKAQNQRTRAIESFRSGATRVLVATDVAARGLDIDNITHVVNFDMPVEPESYVHRIGRTGRAGATGVAISFCDDDERPQLRDIERLTGKRIELLRPPADLPVADPAELIGTSAGHVSHRAYPSHPPARPRKPDHAHRNGPAQHPRGPHQHAGGPTPHHGGSSRGEPQRAPRPEREVAQSRDEGWQSRPTKKPRRGNQTPHSNEPATSQGAPSHPRHASSNQAPRNEAHPSHSGGPQPNRGWANAGRGKPRRGRR